MNGVLTTVDLAKARAFAGALHSDSVADWIHTLADEVESQARALRLARESEQAALADAARLQEERDQTLAALNDILARIATIVPGVPR